MGMLVCSGNCEIAGSGSRDLKYFDFDLLLIWVCDRLNSVHVGVRALAQKYLPGNGRDNHLKSIGKAPLVYQLERSPSSKLQASSLAVVLDMIGDHR